MTFAKGHNKAPPAVYTLPPAQMVDLRNVDLPDSELLGWMAALLKVRPTEKVVYKSIIWQDVRDAYLAKFQTPLVGVEEKRGKDGRLWRRWAWAHRPNSQWLSTDGKFHVTSDVDAPPFGRRILNYSPLVINGTKEEE